VVKSQDFDSRVSGYNLLKRARFPGYNSMKKARVSRGKTNELDRFPGKDFPGKI
jgi:hypothetical protein